MAQMEPDTYYGFPTTWSLDVASTGSQLFYIVFNIRHRRTPDGKDWEEVGGNIERTVRFYLTPDAEAQSIERLERIGFNGDFNDPDFLPEFKNKGTELECTIGTYQNRPQERWQLPRPAAREPVMPDKDFIRRLNAKWRERHGKPAMGSAAEQRPAPSGPTNGATDADSKDIPF